MAYADEEIVNVGTEKVRDLNTQHTETATVSQRDTSVTQSILDVGYTKMQDSLIFLIGEDTLRVLGWAVSCSTLHLSTIPYSPHMEYKNLHDIYQCYALALR